MTTQYLEQQRLTTPARETEAQSQSTPHVRGRIASFVVTVQLILLVAHWFVYQTWMSFRPDPDPPGATALQLSMFVLSLAFVGASLLAFRYSNACPFMRRIVKKLTGLQPDIVFLAGDLYDGNKVNVEEVVSPLKKLFAKFGAYFVTGNHEEFASPTQYLDAIRGTGVGVLDNEKLVIDGLQIIGVNDGDSAA